MSDNNLMLLVTTGGYIPGEDNKYTENVSEFDRDYLLEKLPQMLRCMSGYFVRQIEDPEHPFNGWQIENIIIERLDSKPNDETDDPDFHDGDLKPFHDNEDEDEDDHGWESPYDKER